MKMETALILAALAAVAWWYRCELFGVQCGTVTVGPVVDAGVF